MKHILFLLLFASVFMQCQTEKEMTSTYSAQVGDIFFEEKIDDPKFKRCFEKDLGFQYYNDTKGFEFEGEKIAIIKQLEKLKLQGNKESNGYITFRFLVNWEGKSGLFRAKSMNFNYIEENSDQILANQLLSFTKKLEGCKIKEYNGVKLDYYQYLTYKIEDGKVSEILP
ncbi:hypothetical protein [Chryseobacterium sp.]|uniref:hypothetical protein n=1 Tax=Chryseobacterium sp. TaxID=1871047 RepID=UPI00388F3703